MNDQVASMHPASQGTLEAFGPYMEVDVGGGRRRMVPVNYPANSKKAKDEKRVEKVTIGDVTQRKKPLLSRITGSLSEEDSQSVAQYVLLDVLIPAAKNMISDAVSQGIERLLFGDSRPRSGSRPGYTNYSKPGRPQHDQRDLSRRSRATHDFDDIVLSTRAEAEEVLDRLGDLVDKYEVATVADLYDLVGISGNFTDDKWGWYDLRPASIRHIRSGYLVVLPKTQPID